MRKLFVIVDGKELTSKDVKVIAYEEDFDGSDLLIFEYNGKEYTRKVLSK